MNYLIVTDLDGTIIDNKCVLSSYTVKVFKHLQALGHKIVINTGRTKTTSIKYYEALGLDTVMINDNGAYVSNPSSSDYPVQMVSLDEASLSSLMATARKHHLLGALYLSNGNGYFEAADRDDLLAIFEDDEISTFKKTSSYQALESLPTSVILFINVSEASSFVKDFKDMMDANIGIRSWGKYKDAEIFEAYPLRINKYSSLLKVMSELGISNSKLITFGDSMNDLEMIENAGLGVAVYGSWVMKHLKEKGTLKNTTAYEGYKDGVAEFLVDFFQIDRKLL